MKMLFQSVESLKMNAESFMVVSPDEGALHRNMYYASVLGVELGMFYKRRDYARIVNGRNPIVAHEYLGNSVEGKDVFITDDIISSGESMLEVAQELKKRKAGRIIAYATYPIFTAGLEAFDKAFEDGIIDYVFGTNLTYLTPELLSRDWFYEVDVSKYIAYLIAALNYGVSISKVIDPHQKVEILLEKYGVK
jgi:ribose-phosphate pyrophosphokinase